MCSIQCLKQVKKQPTAIPLLLNVHRKRFAFQCRRLSEKAIRVKTGIYPMDIQWKSKILYFLVPRHPDTSWEDIRTPQTYPKYLLRRYLDVSGVFPTSLHVQIDGILLHLDTRCLFLVSQMLRNSLVDSHPSETSNPSHWKTSAESLFLVKESDACKWFTDYVCSLIVDWYNDKKVRYTSWKVDGTTPMYWFIIPPH